MANLIPYFGPAFLVAVGFVDPGNWVTVIEGGSRFGYELAWVVFFSTFLAMLLQTVSARLGLITGKHLAQICREEFPSPVCTLLWFLCEISIITLDLSMVLGTAIGLNVLLRIPILPSLLLMAVDSLLFIVILPLLVMKRAVVITVVVVGIVLLCCLLDSAFTSALPVSLVVGLLPKLRHETLYSTISIVGANVMPHNFYLHSALVKDESQGNQSLSTSSHYYFLDTLFAFSAVLVVNLAVLSVAVAGFHNAGLIVLTLQDAQALIEQTLNNSFCPAVFGLALLCAGQLSTLNGSSAGQVVSETFLDYKIHPWQHRILIRGIALVPVATCWWRYGNEGPYQMLVFSQVLLALHLPFTVAPLIKVTSSARIMGHHKNSFSFETLAWLSLGMLSAVNVTLVFDLVFGENEDGASFGGYEYLAGFELLTEIGGDNFQSAFFAVISVGTTLSLGFLVWLIFTPLQLDTQLPEQSLWIEDYTRQEEGAGIAREALGTRPVLYKTFDTSLLSEIAVESMENDNTLLEDAPLIAVPHNIIKVLQLEAIEEADPLAPIKIQDVQQLLCLESCEDLSSRNQISCSNSSAVGSPVATSPPESATSFLSFRKPLTIEGAPRVEDAETVALTKAEAEADADTMLLGKDDDEKDAWGSLEKDVVLADSLIVNVDGTTHSSQCEGPESGRGDTSVGSEGGSGSGSLSRLSGLGRSARRQFALILDEFWANLFNLHGQPLPPPLSQGCLAGPKVCPSSGNLHTLSTSHDGSDGHKSHSKQQKSSWKKLSNMSDQAHDMEAYVLRMHTNAAASTSAQLLQTQSQENGVSPSYRSERRYSSMHMPVYHEGYDYQPATIHGYRCPSFTGRTGTSLKARSLHLDLPLFGPRTPLSHGLQVDTDTSSLVEDYGNTSDYSGQPLLSSPWVSNIVSGRSLIDTRGSDRLLTQTEKHLGGFETLSYDSCQGDPLLFRSRDSSLERWNPLVYRATGELDMKNTLGNSQELKQRASISHSPIGRGGQGDHVERAPLVFDELSPSQSHREAFSIQTTTSGPETQSLWSRQPFEQLFGAIDADGFTAHVPIQTRSSSQLVQPSMSCSSSSDGVEIESEVLEKLQICVGKLLRLDGANWLFRTDNGADEDLITAIANAQKTSVEAKMNEPHRLYGKNEHSLLENYSWAHVRNGTNDSITSQRLQRGVPSCGKGCVWNPSLLVSFGVWCVHRVLELAFMESRPELWGKYTYVLNRLQGILEPAFSKPRLVPIFCRCVNDLVLFDIGQCRNSSSRQGDLQECSSGDFGRYSVQSYPQPWPWGRNKSCAQGKGLSAATFLDMIKEVESAVGSRKGRTGTAAGDIAFPKGKENLASVLKRYKRRLSSKPPGLTGLGSGSRRV